MTSQLPSREDWPESIQTSGAFAAKQLDDGRWICLCNMAGANVRLNVVDDPENMFAWASDAFCYHDPGWALLCLIEWDGEGDPWGWVRHIGSARRREYDRLSNGKDDRYREWVNP